MNAGDPYTTAQNGLEAVEAFKADRFKAVVMGKYTFPDSIRQDFG